MTKPQTDITILTDEQIAEIEARANAATKGDWTIRGASWIDGGVSSAGYGVRFADTPMDVTYGGWDARTNFPPDTEQGRQASADRTFIAHAREDIPALCTTVRALRAENKVLKFDLHQANGWIADVEEREAAVCPEDVEFDEYIRALQSQLEQATKERDEEKRLRAELKQIAQTGIAEVSSVATALGDNALIDFRARVVALCRDKATEWRREAARGQTDYARASREKAVLLAELAAELEQLK